MYRFTHFIYLLTAVFVLVSCKSSDVASDHWLQKRKYRKGFHMESIARNISINKHISQKKLSRKGQEERRIIAVKPIQRIASMSISKGKPEIMEHGLKRDRVNEKASFYKVRKTWPSDSDMVRHRSIQSLLAIGDDYFGEDEAADMVKWDRYALISFVLSIASIFSIFVSAVFPIVSILFVLLSVASLIYGIKGVKSERRLWMAVVGITIGGIFTLISFIGLLIVLFVLLLFI